MTITGNDIIALVTGGALELAEPAPIVAGDASTFYLELATTAEELIAEYGRIVTFIRFNQWCDCSRW